MALFISVCAATCILDLDLFRPQKQSPDLVGRFVEPRRTGASTTWADGLLVEGWSCNGGG
ncbi:peptidase c7 family domain-containing protein [Anopheles sinensis]|uniref:Peptidase c7 family domain-containing protein n=1 Tax=Anopheles sinensis TaxID=74873 RepID=A0A084W286_ANOSI|nr:peptidase c7 family domain-containing protein [Anopheles sinensis]